MPLYCWWGRSIATRWLDRIKLRLKVRLRNESLSLGWALLVLYSTHGILAHWGSVLCMESRLVSDRRLISCILTFAVDLSALSIKKWLKLIELVNVLLKHSLSNRSFTLAKQALASLCAAMHRSTWETDLKSMALSLSRSMRSDTRDWVVTRADVVSTNGRHGPTRAVLHQALRL